MAPVRLPREFFHHIYFTGNRNKYIFLGLTNFKDLAPHADCNHRFFDYYSYTHICIRQSK